MSFGLSIENSNGSLLYNQDSINTLFFIGKRRLYGNEWFRPMGVENYTHDYVAFAQVVVGDANLGGIMYAYISKASGYEDGRYIGYSLEGLWPDSSAGAGKVNKSVYADVFIFGSIKNVPKPAYGLLINKSDGVTPLFHTATPPLSIQDLQTISANTVKSFANNVAIPVAPWLFHTSNMRDYRLQANAKTLRTMNWAYPSYNRYNYATSYTVPVINADFYRKYPNIVNP